MASNDNWIKRVLLKLNELFLEGSDFNDRRWIFDWDNKLSISKNLENVWNEDRALETLTKAGVIKSHSIENRYRSDQLDYWDMHGKDKLLDLNWFHGYDSEPALREYDYIRGLDGFNYKNFERFCELHGFNPINNGIVARLEIASGVTPVILAQGDKYRLLSLTAGSVTQAVVAYAASCFDKEVELDELRNKVGKVQLKDKGANLRQVFKNNIFMDGNTLSAFAEISPNSILLKSHATLTPNDLNKIQKTSTN